MIPRMLSPASLAAFSVGTQSPHPARVQTVRATGSESPAPAAPPAPAAQAASPSAPDPTARTPRLLPRGSLLDLSV
jgi:hypothetical protein